MGSKSDLIERSRKPHYTCQELRAILGVRLVAEASAA